MNTEDLPTINIDPTNKKEPPAILYSNELKEDLKLTMSNLREKALTTSSMKAKWVGYMAKEKDALQRLLAIRSDYQKSLLAKNKGGNAFDKLKNSTQEDETLKKIDATRKNIELSLEVISQAIASLTEFGYNIKNSIEVIKLNNS
jgi:hypothetical protein